MMLLRRTAILVAAAIALAVPTSPLRAADPPFEIDAILPLTGLFAFAGQSGLATVKSAEVVVNRTGGIRGRPVRFNIRDDQSNGTVAVQLLNEVIAKKSPVVVGSMLSATCYAMMPLVQTSGPLHYCISPGIRPPAGSYSFTGGPSIEAFGQLFYRYFRARGWTRVALMTSTDASGQEGENAFLGALKLPENSSLELVAHERMNPTDISIAAQLSRIKAANPQVFIDYTVGNMFGTSLRGIRDIGLDVPVFTGSQNQTIAQLKQYTDTMPKELYFNCFPVLGGVARNAKERAVQERFLAAQKEAGIIPDAPSVAAWDPIMIVVDALRAIGPKATAAQVHEYIENLHDYYGVYGLYDFRDGSQRGLNSLQNLVVARWDPAKQYWVGVSELGGSIRGQR